MVAPSDQFIHLIWRPYVFFSPQTRLLYGAPQVSNFLSYNMGAPQALRSLSLFTIWGPPQISFFACHRGATSDFCFFHKIYGGPLKSVSPLTIWSPLRLVSFLTIWGPVRSVSLHTFWGPLSDQFFLLLDEAPSDQFFAYYMGVPQISFFAYYMGVP